MLTGRQKLFIVHECLREIRFHGKGAGMLGMYEILAVKLLKHGIGSLGTLDHPLLAARLRGGEPLRTPGRRSVVQLLPTVLQRRGAGREGKDVYARYSTAHRAVAKPCEGQSLVGGVLLKVPYSWG